MENLIINATTTTPKVTMDYDCCILNIEGKSYPEHAFDFYKPMLEFLDKCKAQNNNQKLTVNMHLIYFNSSSSKVFFDAMDNFVETGVNVDINWIYDRDNDFAREAGVDFKECFTKLNFNFIEERNK